MRYSQNVIEDIRNGNDIVDVIGSYVALKQKGSSYFGLCPFHKENTPSFSVSPDEQLYHCFGCNASGNVYSFIMQMENYDFIDAVKFLADRINYTLPERDFSGNVSKNNEIKAALYEMHKKAARYYYSVLTSGEGKKAVEYLDGRKISQSARKKYGLGYSPFKKDSLCKFLMSEGYDADMLLTSGLVTQNKKGGYYDKFFNRLMFPIIDVQGRIVGFGGRIIGDGEPKYLNSPDTLIFKKSQNLYSINFARQSRLKEFIIVEGYMDVISIYQAGFHNVVAALGTAFNDEHARALKKYADSVILLFDSDEAGTKAALKAGAVLLENGIRVKVLQVAGAKDPDEYIKKFGREAFSELLKSSQSYVMFKLECEKKKYNLETTEEKIMFTNKAAQILAELDNAIERDAYIDETVRVTGISKEAVSSEIKKLSDSIIVNKQPKKYNQPKYKTTMHGIDDGRKNILKVMASNYLAYAKIREVLNPEEFVNPVYVKLAEIIDEFYKKGQTLYSAEIVNYFDTVDEQRTVSEIFMLQKDFDKVSVLEKALNDQIKAVKKAYVDMLIPISESAQDIKKLIDDKKNIDSLNITLSDG